MRKIIAALLAVMMLVSSLVTVASAAESTLPYSDVKANDWFYEYVKFTYESGLMKGTGGNKFDPEGNLTRGMFVTILGRLAECEPVDVDIFPDVKKGEWYYDYVGWAYQAKIVNGYENGNFGPNDNITREQIAACVERFVNYTGLKLPRENTAPAQFADADKVESWAVSSVEVLRRSGIINGDAGTGMFRPQDNVTRAQTATIVKNLVDAFAKAWQGYIPDPDKDGFAIYGAKYLYTSGFGLQGGLAVELDESGEYPFLYAYEDAVQANTTYEAADSFGFSPIAVQANLRETPYVKICYTYEGADEPDTLVSYLSVRNTGDWSQRTASLEFVKNEKDAGYTTAICNTTAAVAETSATFGPDAPDNVRIMLKPYAETADGAKFYVRYIALFETEAEAEAFTAADMEDYLKNYQLYSGVEMKEINEEEFDDHMALVRDRIAEIKSSPSVYTPEMVKAKGGKCYYVSSINGDDSNTGTSPDQAWKSVEKLWKKIENGQQTIWVSVPKAGDAVFFERGSEFYTWRFLNDSATTLDSVPDVIYSAYGDANAPKPRFYGSYDFGGGTGNWQTTEWDDIYVLDLREYIPEEYHYLLGAGSDIGSIIFNEGEYKAVRVYSNEYEKAWKLDGAERDQVPLFGEGIYTRAMGIQGTCKEYYFSGGTTCKDPGDALRNNLEFFHDWTTGLVYLRCEYGDPMEYFDRIDLCAKNYIVWGAERVIYDNIAVMYTSWIGIDLGAGSEALYCEAGYCGGCWESVGGGIGGYGACEKLVIDNCYIHDIEDGPMGTQETGDFSDDVTKIPELNGVVCTNNVVTTGKDVIELFSTSRTPDEGGILGRNKIRNAVVTGNIGAYMGYGYASIVDVGGDALILHNYYYGEMINCVFAENTVIASRGNILGAHLATDSSTRGWFTYDNTYIVNPKHCNILQGGDAFYITSLNKSYYCACSLAYNLRNIQYITSLGIETTSDFYYYTFETDAEKAGAFITTAYYIERGIAQ